jgi:hypothetical protein
MDEDDELLEEDAPEASAENARFAGAAAATRMGEDALEEDDAACWAWTSEAVPAIRKVNAAARLAIERKLRFVCIV